MCPEASSTSDPVELAESDVPNEAAVDPGRGGRQELVHADGAEEESGNGYRIRGHSSGRGITSRRHVMSTTSSATPGC